MSISPRYRDYMGYQDILPLTAALSLPHDSCENFTGNSTYAYASLLPTTRKLMDSVSELSRHLNNTSVSWAMIDKNVGKLGSHLLSLPRIQQPILPINTPPTAAYMVGTLAPFTSTMTMNSPPPPPKNGSTEGQPSTTRSTTPSSKSTSKEVLFISKRYASLLLTTGFWLTAATYK